QARAATDPEAALLQLEPADHLARRRARDRRPDQGLRPTPQEAADEAVAAERGDRADEGREDDRGDGDPAALPGRAAAAEHVLTVAVAAGRKRVVEQSAQCCVRHRISSGSRVSLSVARASCSSLPTVPGRTPSTRAIEP